MFQDVWDARILTGGVSAQREPMSTAPMSLTSWAGDGHIAHHWAHCFLKPISKCLLTYSIVSSARGKLPGVCSHCVETWPDPFASAHRSSLFLFVVLKEGDEGLKVSCQRRIIKDGAKVHILCAPAVVVFVCPHRTINMLFSAVVRSWCSVQSFHINLRALIQRSNH